MVNNNYRNGAARERRIKHQLEAKGYIVIRSSGSHSKIDLIAINLKTERILFIQCKPRSMSNNAKESIKKSLSIFNKEFIGSAHCISQAKEISLEQDL